MKEKDLVAYLNLASWVGENEYVWRVYPLRKNRDDLAASMREFDHFIRRFGRPSIGLLKKKRVVCLENQIRESNYLGSDYLIGLIVKKGKVTGIKPELPFSIVAVENDHFKGLDLYENYCGGCKAGTIFKGRLYLINDSVEKNGLPWSAVFEEIIFNLRKYNGRVSRRG